MAEAGLSQLLRVLRLWEATGARGVSRPRTATLTLGPRERALAPRPLLRVRGSSALTRRTNEAPFPCAWLRPGRGPPPPRSSAGAGCGWASAARGGASGAACRAGSYKAAALAGGGDREQSAAWEVEPSGVWRVWPGRRLGEHRRARTPLSQTDHRSACPRPAVCCQTRRSLRSWPGRRGTAWAADREVRGPAGVPGCADCPASGVGEGRAGSGSSAGLGKTLPGNGFCLSTPCCAARLCPSVRPSLYTPLPLSSVSEISLRLCDPLHAAGARGATVPGAHPAGAEPSFPEILSGPRGASPAESPAEGLLGVRLQSPAHREPLAPGTVGVRSAAGLSPSSLWLPPRLPAALGTQRGAGAGRVRTLRRQMTCGPADVWMETPNLAPLEEGSAVPGKGLGLRERPD